MPRQPVAIAYRPSLPSGEPDWSGYRLQVTRFHGHGPDPYSTETLTFPDKPAALSHARDIGAICTV